MTKTMATSPTTKSALLSGAAKDDVVGLDGDFTFTIAELLANDPGGAAKVNVDTQFFFGDTAADRADQVGYMAKHGITANGDGTYTIEAGAPDFNYFVQIGNKGTWSTAHVDVAHAGASLFTENFDDYATIANPTSLRWEAVDLGKHDWATSGADLTDLGVAAESQLGCCANEALRKGPVLRIRSEDEY